MKWFTVIDLDNLLFVHNESYWQMNAECIIMFCIVFRVLNIAIMDNKLWHIPNICTILATGTTHAQKRLVVAFSE